MVPGLQVLPIGEDEPVWDFVNSGGIDLSKEVDFKPDWSTFKYLPHLPGHAFCLGLTFSRGWSSGWFWNWISIAYFFLALFLLETNGPWEFDPRWLLRKLTQQLKEKYNLKMVCGTETEFVSLSCCSMVSSRTIILIFLSPVRLRANRPVKWPAPPYGRDALRVLAQSSRAHRTRL